MFSARTWLLLIGLGLCSRVLAHDESVLVRAPSSTLSFSPDEKRVLLLSAGRQIVLYDRASRIELFRREIQTAGAFQHIAHTPDGRLITCACDYGRVKVFEAATGEERLELKVGEPNPGEAELCGLASLRHGDRLFALCRGGE